MLTLPALVFRKFMNLVISFYIQPQWGKKALQMRNTSEVNGNNLKEKSSEALTGELILITFKIPTFYHIA